MKVHEGIAPIPTKVAKGLIKRIGTQLFGFFFTNLIKIAKAQSKVNSKMIFLVSSIFIAYFLARKDVGMTVVYAVDGRRWNIYLRMKPSFIRFVVLSTCYRVERDGLSFSNLTWNAANLLNT